MLSVSIKQISIYSNRSSATSSIRDRKVSSVSLKIALIDIDNSLLPSKVKQ